MTDRSRVLYLPTHDDYSILPSSHEPKRLLDGLREGS